MRKLYLFDFDGTLTTKDTMFEFLKFYNPRKFRVQFLKFIVLFAFVKMKISDAETVKKSFISSFLKNEKKSVLEARANAFCEENFSKIMRPNALEFIKNIQPEKTESYIVSASLDIWVRPFAEKLGLKLIATRAEFKDERFTGNFVGKNCNGAEKVDRIITEIAGKKYDKIIAFGDTAGDKEMLAFSDEGHFRFFQ